MIKLLGKVCITHHQVHLHASPKSTDLFPLALKLFTVTSQGYTLPVVILLSGSAPCSESFLCALDSHSRKRGKRTMEGIAFSFLSYHPAPTQLV